MTSTMRFDRWEAPDTMSGVNIDQLVGGTGLVPVIPSAVNVITTGSGSFNSTSGLVTFSNTEGVRVRGCFTSEFTNYRIIIRATAASSGTSGEFRARLASGSTDISSDYEFYGNWVRSNNTNGTIGSASYGNFSIGWINSTSTPFGLILDIQNPATPDWTRINCQSSGWDGGATIGFTGNGFHKITTSYDSIIFNPQAGTFSGIIKIYGYR